MKESKIAAFASNKVMERAKTKNNEKENHDL